MRTTVALLILKITWGGGRVGNNKIGQGGEIRSAMGRTWNDQKAI